MLFAIRRRARACAASFYLVGAVAAFAAAPTITGLNFPGTPTTARFYAFNITFSAPVTITGSPTIGLRVNGIDRPGTISDSSGYANAIVEFTPQSGDNGPLSVPGPIALNGGSIKGADGTDADLTFTPVDNTGITIDTMPPAPPVVSSITPSSPTYQQSFTFTGTAEPTSTINFRGNTPYLLPSGTTDANGNWSVTIPAQPAGTYNFSITARDHAGNESSPTSATVTVTYLPGNGTSPQILGISPMGSGLYGGYYNTRHDMLRVSLNFDQPVLVRGSPTLTVQVGSVTTALVCGGTDGNSLIFFLNLPSLMFDGTLDITGPINLNGGAITATDGTPATLTFTPVNTAVYIDTTPPPAPVVTGVTPSSPSADQPFTLQGTAEAGDRIEITGVGTTTVTADASGNWSATFGPLAAGSYRFALSAEDKAGNWSYLAGWTGGSPTYYTVTVHLASTATGSGSGLANISTRVHVSASDSAGSSIAGFVVTGTTPRQFLIRGVGPTLANYGVASPLAAPLLRLFNSSSAMINSNAGWADDAQIAAAASAVNAFPLQAGSKDAALLVTLAPGSYTAQVASSGSGTALIEVYDVVVATTPTWQLINISTLGTVGAGDDVLIGGFVISGDQPKRLLIRGVGPGVARFVNGWLRDPILTLYDGHQTVIARNDNWQSQQPVAGGPAVGTGADTTAAASATGAFPLEDGSTDAALLVTLPPGSYTAIVTGANGTSGNALVEVYEVP